MTRRTLVGAALLLATGLLPGSAFAQTESPAPSIERARQLSADGRAAEALDMLRHLPSSVDSTTLRIEIALTLKDFSQAVAAYEELAGPLKAPSRAVLATIATTRALSLRADTDPQVRVAACEALMLAGSAPECRAELQGTANDPTASFENRLTAARVLVEHKMPDAARLLDAVINQGIQNGPAVTAEALARMPPSVSNEPLKRLLSSENADAQYLAARALAPRRVKDAMAPLRSVATDPEAGAARLMAYIGLAALGELDGLRTLRETLPLKKGRERLEAARALTLLEDPTGPPMLEALLAGEHELLRIETAEQLYPTRPSAAQSTLTAAVDNANPWIGASAIAAASRVGIPVTRSIRRAVGDSNAHVAAAAVRAVLMDLRTRR